jgi:PAS domain S-box-containing protein
MTDTFLMFLWLQVASGLLQSGILFGLYIYVYREEFLKYWCLANAYGVTSLAFVLLLFRFAPATAPQAHVMHMLATPQLVLLALATLSLGSRGLSRGQKNLVAGLTVAYLGMQAITGLMAGDVAHLVAVLRLERQASSGAVILWFGVTFWRKYPLARTVAGRVANLFIGLHAVHYLLSAAAGMGLPLFPPSGSTLTGVLGAVLPIGTSAGLFLLALGSAARASNAVRESEDRYRTLLRTSPDAFLLTDTAGNIAMCNQRAVDLLGYASERELIGLQARLLLAPAERAEIAKRLRASLRGGVARDVACMLMRKDGSVFPGEISATQVPRGGVTEWMSLVRDISERRQAEERIRLLAHAVRSASDCIVICDTTDHILFANHACLQTYEYEAQELIGQNIRIFRASLDQDDAPADLLAQTLRDGWRGDLWNRSKTGRVFPISLATSVVRDEQGNPLALVGVSRDETNAKNSEMTLRESERRFRELLDNVQMMAVMLGTGGAITFCNDYVLAATGWTREEMIGRPFYEFVPRERRMMTREMIEGSLARGEAVPFVEGTLLKKDGGRRVVQWNNTVLRGPDEKAVGFASLGVDITAHRELQEQYLQAQKLESLGRLAGGVAHDFNNLLTVINGYSALLSSRAAESDPQRRQLDEIRKAGERATSLVQQLLAFSRRQTTEPRVVKLNDMVAGAEDMLRRLMGEDIELTTRLEAQPDEVLADPGQVHQVLMNLVVNARDAMPHGGKLTIQTGNADVRAREAVEDGAGARGAYVQLAVTDSGVGMDQETRERIFEPFFTTKEQGKGTGLGLSTVYGIVRQSAGFIRVDSAPGEGSSFRVFLPQAALAAASVHPSDLSRPGLRGTETVLITEDEQNVRDLAAEVLTSYGYRVLVAADGREALQIAEGRAGAVDLLLTDVVMPGLNGKLLAERLRASRPELRVIFMSGYADEVIGQRGLRESGAAWLPKPFSPEELAAKVREVLSLPSTPRSILVVDDEEGVRTLLQEVLGERYRVLVAGDGREALETISVEPDLDLVITDLVMPNVEGIETIQAIRKMSPGMKIIAMSGALGGHFLKSAKALGADATLVKPIRPDRLQETVGELLKLVN